MRTSQLYFSTLKEAPSEAELVSHKLMLRAGLIKRLGSGLYTWMPLGLKVLRKVEGVVRDEMDKAGAQELLMPTIQPAELWQETGRWALFGPQMLKIKDRHERDFCFGPTHEEVITDIARLELRSYKQLPVNFYQVQVKFRDEIRPRFGVMRAREFVMKDAYSFDASFEGLQASYGRMYQAYSNVFSRLGLAFRAVAADTGAIGGSGSHEFHVLADAGEDLLAYCPDSDYAANVELAEALAPAAPRAAASEALHDVETPKQTTCEQVAGLMGIPIEKTVKLIAVIDAAGKLVIVLLRGDHSLNEVKLGKVEGMDGFRFATEEEIRAAFNCPPGFLGPVGAPAGTRIIADRTVAAMSDWVCGANKPKFHIAGVNWGRDLPEADVVADVRNVVAGDPSPDGRGVLALCRGIEVGHVFQLRTKYSEAMNATFTDVDGQLKPFEMGCYGIGVSRIVGAAIEQNHDERGIRFPLAMAPFALAVVAVGYHRSDAVKAAADQLYAELQAAGVDVLLDDRNERPGSMFADMELIGIPHRLTLGDKGLAEGMVEYVARRGGDLEKVPLGEVAAFIRRKLAE
ncbi:proline--tRNA ligase [Chitiniphilus purpureus]|uniref:Proline--tRNA ligase n=1 Tax=Chitiniphilus purpureus TaxID=2981137 RepID=A0ABY6DK49_9NEIS|nr:proline--tRNA ligase [Chitiniphilus sp. CD1]UXY14724.1 proline--tRNA ligase [Chitiniphilus sp. CD1]